MHLGVVLSHLPSLAAGPHHKGVHGPLHVGVLGAHGGRGSPGTGRPPVAAGRLASQISHATSPLTVSWSLFHCRSLVRMFRGLISDLVKQQQPWARGGVEITVESKTALASAREVSERVLSASPRHVIHISARQRRRSHDVTFSGSLATLTLPPCRHL